MNQCSEPIHCQKLDCSNSGDSVVDSVIQKFLQRSALGQVKYGTTLDRTDLKTENWIQHTQEELMDAILYLEKLKQSYTKNTTNLHRRID